MTKKVVANTHFSRGARALHPFLAIVFFDKFRCYVLYYTSKRIVQVIVVAW